MPRRLLWLLVGVEIGRSLGSLSGFAAHRNDDLRGMKVAAGSTLLGSTSGSLNASFATAESTDLSSTTDLNLAADTDADDDGAIIIATGGDERMRIANDGNVGIGTAKPGSRLDAQAGATDEVIARFGRDDDGEFQSLVEARAAKTLFRSGNEIGRGAIRLYDRIDNRTLELGYYDYGAGLFSQSLFEFWTNGVSILGPGGGNPTFLAVREPFDRGDLRLRHDGTQGVIETTGGPPGFLPGGIQIGGNGPNTFLTLSGEVMVMTDEGNIGIGTATGFGSGIGVIGIAEAKTIPTTNPAGGGVLYVEDGSLKYRSPLGTVTIIAQP